MEALVNSALGLAAKIAREFRDIPGLPHAEIEMTAREALARAAAGYDPQKGAFEAYAATAIRNALRDLRDRQARHHRHHAYILDETTTGDDSDRPKFRDKLPASSPPIDHQVALAESRALLARAMASLPPRLRTVADGIQSGKNYREIGESLGISKQAAHKLAGAAIASLRESLAKMGYPGLDTLGLLKSGQVSCSPPQVDDSIP
jgi:RNA polymerase sigma factor (sigma-70 family)